MNNSELKTSNSTNSFDSLSQFSETQLKTNANSQFNTNSLTIANDLSQTIDRAHSQQQNEDLFEGEKGGQVNVIW